MAARECCDLIGLEKIPLSNPLSISSLVKTEAAAVAKQKGYCTGNFSVCRKYEDDVVTAIYACSQVGMLKDLRKNLPNHPILIF